MGIKYPKLAQCLLASTVFLQGLVYADTTISSPLQNADTTTFAQGNITIASTGQLWMNAATPNNGDAIVVDTENSTVTINASNTNGCKSYGGIGCAIITEGAGGNGINITTDVNGAGTTSTIAIQSGSSIIAADNGLNVDQGMATITNQGTIKGVVHAVYFTPNGQGASFTNSGLLQNQGNTALSVVLVDGPSLTFVNSNSIISTTVNTGVRTNVNFTSISNTGTITALNRALLIAGNASGSVSNSGTLQSTAGDNTVGALEISGAYSGTLSNSNIIETTSTNALGGVAVLISNDFGIFNNSGIIRATKTLGVGVKIDNSTVGFFNILSGGSITAIDSPAILLGDATTATFNALNNAGTLKTASVNGVIYNSNNAVNIGTGITNSGDITNTLAGSPSINLRSDSKITVTQNGGTITGDIVLAGSSSVLNGPVFVMAGGTITDNVLAASVNKNIYNVTGGTLNGILDFGTQGDTLNLSGGFINSILGDTGIDTFNISGGNFKSLEGFANADVLNGAGTVNLTGTINNVPTINIMDPTSFQVLTGNNTASGNAFTTSGKITNVNTAVNVTGGGLFIENGILTGTGNLFIDNLSTLQVGPTASMTLNNGTNNGNLTLEPQSNPISASPTNFNLHLTQYTQNAGAVLSPVMAGPTAFGAMQVGAGGATLSGASVIHPLLQAGAYIPNTTVFTIIDSVGAVAVAPPVIQPNSLTVRFDSRVLGTQLQLVTERVGYSYFVNDPNAFAIAQVLDQFSIGGLTPDQTMANAMGQLDLITNIDDMTHAIDSLGPQINYAMVDGMNVIMTRSFNSIQRRLDQVKGVRPIWQANYKIRRPYEGGFSYGDDYGDVDLMCTEPCKEVYFGTWIKLLAEYLNQTSIGNFSGYHGNAVGFAAGLDWSLLENSLIGLAGSAMKVNMVDSNTNGNIEDLESYQLTLYGFFDPHIDCVDDVIGWYIDGLLGFASSNFKNRRNIYIGNFKTAGFSSFYGIQYGAQLDTGYTFLYQNLYIAPIGRFKYTYLMLNNYTESGAGGLDLSVANQDIQALLGGFGFRMAAQLGFVTMKFYPELELLYLYDFANQGQETVANFLGGGTAFATNGPKPGRNIGLFDLGFTAISNDHYVFSAKYELEYRNHFLGNSGYLELYHRWS